MSRPQQDQTAYIMSLEQQNLHLKEANLNLQEVGWVSQHLHAPCYTLRLTLVGQLVLAWAP